VNGGRRRTLRELGDLGGRGALVAGGAGHVGGAVVETLAEMGARVVVCDLDADADASGIPCDLADEAAARAAVREAVSRLGGLDVLVHCAALVGTSELDGWAVPFPEQSAGAWDTALRVNLTSAFVLAHEAREALAASGRGSVILFSSTYGVVAPDFALYDGTDMGNPAGYGASKAGLVQLARYLATALAPDVRVNAISPGGIERGQPDAFRERYRARTPLRRLATEEDVKGAVAFLASDLSAYVTGQNLLVDGGWTAW
jgi:NAD(P)-dependent dehydrogenase (short-subunit alcohol dehydrogenase family)